jgi:hypothetical protein
MWGFMGKYSAPRPPRRPNPAGAAVIQSLWSAVRVLPGEINPAQKFARGGAEAGILGKTIKQTSQFSIPLQQRLARDLLVIYLSTGIGILLTRPISHS